MTDRHVGIHARFRLALPACLAALSGRLTWLGFGEAVCRHGRQGRLAEHGGRPSQSSCAHFLYLYKRRDALLPYPRLLLLCRRRQLEHRTLRAPPPPPCCLNFLPSLPLSLPCSFFAFSCGEKRTRSLLQLPPASSHFITPLIPGYFLLFTRHAVLWRGVEGRQRQNGMTGGAF